MKTNNPTFTKLYTQILGMTEISGNAKLLLTFIVSHSENNQKFYYTNEDLMERLGVSSLSTMVRIVRELESFDLITSIQHKNFYFNEICFYIYQVIKKLTSPKSPEVYL